MARRLSDNSCGTEQVADPDRIVNLCLGRYVAPALQILGCMKCGTTTLHYEIFQRTPSNAITHGRVLSGEFWFTKKEKHFFDRDETYKKGINWYLKHYPKCMANAPIVGVDATQGYSKVASVPARMRESYGDQAGQITFVFVLRDPVKRLFSNYFHRKKCCLGDTTFEQWIELQIKEAQTCIEKGVSPNQLWPECGEEGLFAGFYGLQLDRWLESFCPSQFLLISFNGFVKDPGYTIGRIIGRVGIKKAKGIHVGGEFGKAEKALPVKRKNGKTPGDQEMMATTRKRLEEYYTPFNLKAIDLVERTPSFNLVPNLESIRSDIIYH